MARYTGPTNKLFRNYGVKDLSARKLTSSMTQYASGQHGQNRKKVSEYAVQLKEKQKVELKDLLVLGYHLLKTMQQKTQRQELSHLKHKQIRCIGGNGEYHGNS